MGQKASKEVAKRAATADPLTGFYRGAIRTPQEEAQTTFLRGATLQQQQGAGQPSKPSEMPVDLIKFMTDVGPLKLKDESMMKRKTRPTDSSRKTENMRLAEQIEGYETARTSSFSTKRDKEDKDDFGLDVIQMFGMLSKRSETLTIPTEHVVLVENAMMAIQLPELLEDREDKSNIGVAADRSKLGPELQAFTPIPKSRVKLVLEDLWEIDNKETVPERFLKESLGA